MTPCATEVGVSGEYSYAVAMPVDYTERRTHGFRRTLFSPNNPGGERLQCKTAWIHCDAWSVRLSLPTVLPLPSRSAPTVSAMPFRFLGTAVAIFLNDTSVSFVKTARIQQELICRDRTTLCYQENDQLG